MNVNDRVSVGRGGVAGLMKWEKGCQLRIIHKNTLSAAIVETSFLCTGMGLLLCTKFVVNVYKNTQIEFNDVYKVFACAQNKLTCE